MSLIAPNLDDKRFFQIAQEGRAQIPGLAPEWTDHNVSDPGITFIELFAWLAEIQQYRLNTTSNASFDRFLALIGLTRLQRQAAQVAITLGGVTKAILVPANTSVTSPGKEDVPFETVEDLYLTAAVLKRVISVKCGREIEQSTAESDDTGHFEPFGATPQAGDSLRLGFDAWFTEPRTHLTLTLFEDDLPARAPLSPGAPGFVPSATIRWEYLQAQDRWSPLPVVEDRTLQLSRSGDLVFQAPPDAFKDSRYYWIRAVLDSGSFEIAPRILSIRTNTVVARQVETIVNEDLCAGLSKPDQIVRLEKAPLLLDPGVSPGTFEIGEMLDWQAMIMRLAKPDTPTIQYIRDKLGSSIADILADPDLTDRNRPTFRLPNDQEKARMAEAFDKLLSDTSFYQRAKFSDFQMPAEFAEVAAGQARALANLKLVRRLNRLLLRQALADQVVSDRLVVQVGVPVTRVEDEAKSWSVWQQVDDFSKAGPDDPYYILDPEKGEIVFGNGLNGRVPRDTERIRARFYRYSRADLGNIPAGQPWSIAIAEIVSGRCSGMASESIGLTGVNRQAAAGGDQEEPLDDAVLRARAEFRAQSRAVTAEDYELLATKTPGLRLKRAKVLPNFNPKLPKIEFPGDVTILVLPFAPPPPAGVDMVPPQPSKGFLQTVQSFLDSKRLLTTSIHVVGPRFVKVSVTGQIYLKKGASPKETLARVQNALRDFLDPIRGGPVAGAGWRFGRSVFPSEIYQLLAKTEGVDYVVKIALNGNPSDQILKLKADELPFPGEPRLDVTPFEKRRDSAGQAPCRPERGSRCA